MYRIFVFALLIATNVSAAEVTELPRLFPKGTLAYAEVGNPSATADSVAKYLEGTFLANNLEFSHDRRDKLHTGQTTFGLQRAGMLSLIVAPETLAEVKRFKGAAIAITNLNDTTGKPIVAGAILLGDSNAAGLYIRTFLTTSANVRRVGKVDDLPVFQARGLNGFLFNERGEPEPADDSKPAAGPQELTLLYAPGILVFGSSIEAVTDVYRRYQGKETSASFSDHPKLKDYEVERKKPGVYLWFDMPEYDRRMLAIKKSLGTTWFHAEYEAYWRFMLHPEETELLTGRGEIYPDGWSMNYSVKYTNESKSPLVKIVKGPIGDPLSTVDKPYGFTLGLPTKANRTEALLGMADALAKSHGVAGALPGERIKEFDVENKTQLLEALSDISGLIVYMPKHQLAAKGVPQLPWINLYFENEQASESWMKQIPLYVQLLNHDKKPSEPSSEKIKNATVYGLVIRNGERSIPIFYANHGKHILVGIDREGVGRSNIDWAINPGINGWISWPMLLPTTSSSANRADVPVIIEKSIEIRGIDEQPLELPVPGGPATPKANSLITATDEFHKRLGKVPPITMKLTSGDKVLNIQIANRQSKKEFIAAVEGWLSWLDQQPANPNQLGEQRLFPHDVIIKQ